MTAQDPRAQECPISFIEPHSPWPVVGKRELWEQPFWNNKGNNRILPIQFHAVCIYGACLKWLLPDLSIPAASRKDRGLWGREWGVRWIHAGKGKSRGPLNTPSPTQVWLQTIILRFPSFWTDIPSENCFECIFLYFLAYFALNHSETQYPWKAALVIW